MCIMNEAERKHIECIVTWVMANGTSNEYAKKILEHRSKLTNNTLMEDVINDVVECSSWSNKKSGWNEL